MKEILRDKEHLVRVAGLFVAGLLAFLVARALLVPKDFGEYGHYRAGALEDNRDQPLVYAGQGTCETCHDDVAAARMGSRHARIACESCHGPQAAHAGADDPSEAKPALPDPASICQSCHLKNVAKPPGFPQVDPEEHLKDVGGEGETCASCHDPHHPEISDGPAPPAGSEVTP